jgi:hypothetical protein
MRTAPTSHAGCCWRSPGGTAQEIVFPPTGAWTTYATMPLGRFRLAAGRNGIELAGAKGKGPNVDALIVRAPRP